MASAAVLDLVYRRDGGGEIRRHVNPVRIAVTLVAGHLAGVCAAADLAVGLLVARGAAFSIREGVEISRLVLRGYIGVAVDAEEVRMRGRPDAYIFVALGAVHSLGTGKGHRQQERNQ